MQAISRLLLVSLLGRGRIISLNHVTKPSTACVAARGGREGGGTESLIWGGAGGRGGRGGGGLNSPTPKLYGIGL